MVRDAQREDAVAQLRRPAQVREREVRDAAAAQALLEGGGRVEVGEGAGAGAGGDVLGGRGAAQGAVR